MCDSCTWLESKVKQARDELLAFIEGGQADANPVTGVAMLSTLQHTMSGSVAALAEHTWIAHPDKIGGGFAAREGELPW